MVPGIIIVAAAKVTVSLIIIVAAIIISSKIIGTFDWGDQVVVKDMIYIGHAYDSQGRV